MSCFSEKERESARKKYCRYGLHKITSGSSSFQFHDMKRKRKFDFIYCRFCNWKFFATKKDKEDFVELSNRWGGSTKETISALFRSSSSPKLERLEG